jgi:hypothetical protein
MAVGASLGGLRGSDVGPFPYSWQDTVHDSSSRSEKMTIPEFLTIFLLLPRAGGRGKPLVTSTPNPVDGGKEALRFSPNVLRGRFSSRSYSSVPHRRDVSGRAAR